MLYLFTMAFLLICGLLSICLSSGMTAPIGTYKVIDMSYPYIENETLHWPLAKPYKQKLIHRGRYNTIDFLLYYDFETCEHVGTHMDAPIHFSRTGQTVDQVPLEATMGEAVVINITAKAEKNPDYLVTVSDLEEWEKEHGRMPENPIVFLYFGYGKYWLDGEKYFGSKTPMDTKTFHFPGLHPDAATWLVTQRNLKLYGVDAMSLDAGINSPTFPVHVILAKHNIPGIENAANLHLLPPRGAEVIAAPMKMKDGSGGPTRLIARIYENNNVNGCTALTNLNSAVVTFLLVTFCTWFML